MRVVRSQNRNIKLFAVIYAAQPKGITGIWRGKEIRVKRALAAERQRNAQASAAELLRTAYLMLEGVRHD